jgi:hypothetical protein
MEAPMHRRYNIDKEQVGKLDLLTHAKSLLSQANNTYRTSDTIPRKLTLCVCFPQVYYRQNLYVLTAQYCDGQDNRWYLVPILITTVNNHCLDGDLP